MKNNKRLWCLLLGIFTATTVTACAAETKPDLAAGLSITQLNAGNLSHSLIKDTSNTKKASKEIPLAPIKIKVDQLLSGQRIQLGSYEVKAGTICKVSLRWSGESSLSVSAVLAGEKSGKEYSISNGTDLAFTTSKDGIYTFPVRNTGKSALKNVVGTISVGETAVEKFSLTQFKGEESPNPMEFEFDTLQSGANMEHFSYFLRAGDHYTIAMEWEGNGTAGVECRPLWKKEAGVVHQIQNGVAQEFIVPEDGEYSFPIQNNGTNTLINMTGSITFTSVDSGIVFVPESNKTQISAK